MLADLMGKGLYEEMKRLAALADPRAHQSGHGSHHGFREGPGPLARLQKELLKGGGSWRSAVFFSLASYI